MLQEKEKKEKKKKMKRVDIKIICNLYFLRNNTFLFPKAYKLYSIRHCIFFKELSFRKYL